ncbi:uncharacterized protein A1O9_12717 [Exophiala aquamarina CBS 119918]|uniref:Transcription factor domain-containing protein n=1 Tax=Exophiala aquamarina CBS 119918 TaxID=1182545 RepID=A0A072NTM4_9EURO|nr:uncharacterized protein A1O9_12717 [Exophiala aquamarina CBS 119918]KEF51214.1 hypothetical protein A1O9_12717 [Exophiala aquamarina CBS 119918]
MKVARHQSREKWPASKIRCLRERPYCSSCLKRRLPCEYEVPHKPGTPNSLSSSSAPRAQSKSPGIDRALQDDALHDAFIPMANSNPSAASAINECMSSVTTTDHMTLDEGFTLRGTGQAQSQAPPVIDFSSMFADNNCFSTLDTNLGWIFSNNFEDIFASIPPSPGAAEPKATVGLPVERPELQKFQTGDLLLNDLDTQIAIPDLPLPTPRDRCSPDDAWPMEWHASTEQRLVLPSLGQSSDGQLIEFGSFYSLSPITETTRATMSGSIRIPLQRIPWQAVSLANFPSKEKLDHCIDLYFRHFDYIFPILHRATFDPAEFPLLTLSAACIGACYTTFYGAQTFSNSLSELIRRLITFMAEYDQRFVRTEYYVISQLLQSVQGYCCGSRRLFELSESARSALVNNAKNMGLFRYRVPPIDENLNLEGRWREWIRQERLRRLGWAVYELDSSVSYLHNNRPYLSNADIDMEMPSAPEHWEVQSAQAWGALHPWTGRTPRPLRFRPLIRSLFDDTERALAKLDRSHDRIVLLTFVQMMWGVKEMKASPFGDMIPGTVQASEGQMKLQGLIDRFLYLRTNPVAAATLTRRELACAFRQVQMIHMSHLYAAGDLMDWLYPLLRRGPEYESAKARMMKWASQDAVQVREVAFHSSQTLAVFREHQANFPHEPFTAFHAGAVLWCVADLLPKSSSMHTSPGIRLDRLVSHERETVAVKEWIQTGGPQVVSIYGVPNLTAKDGKTQVLEELAALLKRMKPWGIAHNFLKVVTRLMAFQACNLDTCLGG